MIYSKSQIPAHLHNYFRPAEYGLEESPAAYVETMRTLFAEVRRVLANDGTLWLNLGDSYAGSWGAQGVASGMHGSAVAAGQYAPATTRTGSIRPGMPPAKNLMGIPWRVAFALQEDGWILRSDIIWHKPNPMPSSVTDRPTTAHEYVFLFAKSPRYHYDADAIADAAVGGAKGSRFDTGKTADHQLARAQSGERERPQLRRALQLAAEHGLTEKHIDAIRSVGMADSGKAKAVQSGTGKNTDEVQALADEAKQALGGYYREFLTGGTKNARDVWTIATQPFSEAHFAVFPTELAEKCIKAGCKPGGVVLDPFSGSGTTGLVAGQLGRRYIGVDINADYLALSLRTRLAQSALFDTEEPA